MRIFVAGHKGMVGSALVQALEKRGHGPGDLLLRSRSELDLRSREQVQAFFESERPEHVYLAAAKVGGIQANMNAPATFLFDNLMIQCNIIDCAARTGTKVLCFLGSSCIYPRECPQPMKEEYLLTGALEPTNEGYALAKIAGLRMAQYYQKEFGMRCVNPMPCNLYGPGDSFDPVNSHVLSALVRKFVDAADRRLATVTIWGTGKARREFLHVEDLADAVMLLIDRWHQADIINVGSGTDVTIEELARMIARATGYAGEIQFDSSRPDGMPRKCLDVSRIAALGFTPRVDLAAGIAQMIHQYRQLQAG